MLMIRLTLKPLPFSLCYMTLTLLSMSTVLCQKGLSYIFCHFLLFRDYDTTANNTSPVKFLEDSCAWK